MSFGLPQWFSRKNLPLMRETWIQSLGREYPLDKGMGPTPIFLPGKLHGQKNLIIYSPWSHRVGYDQVYKHTSNMFSQYPSLWSAGLAIVKVKVTQSCPTHFCQPGFSVHGILQARILEWVAYPFSSGSSQLRG